MVLTRRSFLRRLGKNAVAVGLFSTIFKRRAQAQTITRYVNTASTAGGDGTTNGTSGSTRAYATLPEALNALPSTLSNPYIIYLDFSGGWDPSNLNQAPWDMVTSATNNLKITTQGKWRATAQWREEIGGFHATNRNGVYNNIPEHVWFDGFQVKMTVTDGSSYVAIKTANANQDAADCDNRISNCFVKAEITSGSVIGFNSRPLAGGGAGTSKIWNCIAWNCTTGFNCDFVTTDVFNCLSYGGDYGYVLDAVNAIKAVNCIAASNALNDFVGTFASGSNYNASTGAGAPGANSRQSQTFTFRNAAAGDFRLSTSDAGAKDFGTSDPGSGLYSDDIGGYTRSGSWDIGASEANTETLEQEGFRWRDDDGSESAATWLASQDSNITRDVSTNTRLRVLLNGTGRPPATTHRLEYRLSGGSYERVRTANGGAPYHYSVGTGVGGAAAVTPVWPEHGPGDIGLLVVESCGGEAVTLSTASGFAQPPNSPQATGSGTAGTQITLFWCRATSSAQASPVVADPGNHAYARIIVFRDVVQSGDPWDVTAGAVKASASTSASAPGVTTTVANALVVNIISRDNDNAAAAFSALANADLTSLTEIADAGSTAGNGGGIGVFSGVKAAAGSVAATTATVTSSINASITIALKPRTAEAILLAASANIAASGADTTVQLTAPSGKATSDFAAGRIADDENPLDLALIPVDDYTELEWCLTAVSGVASNSQVYEFRVTANGVALDTYSVTPTWTIGSGGGPSTSIKDSIMRGVIIRKR